MIMNRLRRRLAASSEHQQATAPPRQRHAIFYDVENTSSPDDVSRVMAELEMNRSRSDTHLVAVGNWRVIGQETARLLARQGAELVHSAPNTGVRDWSDLRIAVDAGMWLGSAKPGDMLDVVSDDQAFDAIGDVAATLGVQFRRIPARNRRVVAPPAREHARRAETGHQASHDDIIGTIRRLTGSQPGGQGTVSLDALSNALKDAGFVRAPGSHRLITRLRRMKELRVSPDGLIRLVAADDGGESPVALPDAPKPRRRRGRRGGRRRGARQHRTGVETGDDQPGAPEPALPDVAR